jgi:Mlc titration factor MtfA (ptsG expression regulator)
VITRWWQRRRDGRALERRAIPDALWDATLTDYPFLAQRTDSDASELRRLTSLFLDRKEFSGAHGFVVTDAIAVAVAAQACLPVLALGLQLYDGFVGIVLHADQVVVAREVTDDHTGVVHGYDDVLAGEAMEGGPVMLSWADVSAAGEHGGDTAYNVVIHEFAHVIDMVDGAADGVPPLPSAAARAAWRQTLMREFDVFSERAVCGHASVIDPYGAQAPEEFFAVASEAFFVAPAGLKEEQPALYRLLASFYRQEPAGSPG